MTKQQPIDFFDPEVQRLAASGGGRLYKMQNSTGEGLISEYAVFPGVEFFYNDFYMKDGQNQNKRPLPDMIEINHCREGRFECELQNGNFQYVGVGDLSIHRLSYATRRTSFPLAHYHGISITIDLSQAQWMIRALEAVMGDLDIRLDEIAEKFCREDTCYVLRSNREAAHIFTELYAVPPERAAHYLKTKVLELLMLLNDLPQESFVQKRQFFPHCQTASVQAMHDAMIQDLNRHYTLAELSRGSFDGNGHTISNLSYSSDDYNCGAGLFGVSCGEVKNLTLENATVTVTEGTSMAIGGGFGGSIDNCTASGTPLQAAPRAAPLKAALPT